MVRFLGKRVGQPMGLDRTKKRTQKRVLIMQELEIDGKPGQAIDLSRGGMYITTSAKFDRDYDHIPARSSRIVFSL